MKIRLFCHFSWTPKLLSIGSSNQNSWSTFFKGYEIKSNWSKPHEINPMVCQKVFFTSAYTHSHTHRWTSDIVLYQTLLPLVHNAPQQKKDIWKSESIRRGEKNETRIHKFTILMLNITRINLPKCRFHLMEQTKSTLKVLMKFDFGTVVQTSFRKWKTRQGKEEEGFKKKEISQPWTLVAGAMQHVWRGGEEGSRKKWGSRADEAWLLLLPAPSCVLSPCLRHVGKGRVTKPLVGRQVVRSTAQHSSTATWPLRKGTAYTAVKNEEVRVLHDLHIYLPWGVELPPERWKWTFCHLLSFRCQMRVSSDCIVTGRPDLSMHCVRRT